MGGLKRATVISATKNSAEQISIGELVCIPFIYLHGSYIFLLFYARKLSQYLKNTNRIQIY